jgi:hypothetical protein
MKNTECELVIVPLLLTSLKEILIDLTALREGLREEEYFKR